MIQQSDNVTQNSSNPRYQSLGYAAPPTGTIILQPVYGSPYMGVTVLVDNINAGKLTDNRGLRIKVKAGEHQLSLQAHSARNKYKISYFDLEISPNSENIYAVTPATDGCMLVEEPSLLGDTSLFLTKKVSMFSPAGNLMLRRFYKNGNTLIYYYDWPNDSFPTSLRCVFSSDLTSLQFFLDRSLRNWIYKSEREPRRFGGLLQCLGDFKFTRYNGETVGYIQQQKDVIYIVKPDRNTKIGIIYLTQIEKDLFYNRDFGLKYIPTDQPIAYVQWRTNIFQEYNPLSGARIRVEDEELMTLAFFAFTTTFFTKFLDAEFAPKN